jgi:hypothetical protein
MARARKMSVGEAKDGRVFVPITGCPLIALFEWPNVCVGRELHHTEGRGRSREGVSLRPCANHGIDQFNGVAGLSQRNRGRHQQGK